MRGALCLASALGLATPAPVIAPPPAAGQAARRSRAIRVLQRQHDKALHMTPCTCQQGILFQDGARCPVGTLIWNMRSHLRLQPSCIAYKVYEQRGHLRTADASSAHTAEYAPRVPPSPCEKRYTGSRESDAASGAFCRKAILVTYVISYVSVDMHMSASETLAQVLNRASCLMRSLHAYAATTLSRHSAD